MKVECGQMKLYMPVRLMLARPERNASENIHYALRKKQKGRKREGIICRIKGF
jgi:hypothetical protein